MKDTSKVVQAASDLYDSGFADGVASVPANGTAPAPAGITPDQEAADIAAATDALNAQIADLKKQIVDITTSKEDEDALLASVKAVEAQLAAILSPPAAPVAPAPLSL